MLTSVRRMRMRHRRLAEYGLDVSAAVRLFRHPRSALGHWSNTMPAGVRHGRNTAEVTPLLSSIACKHGFQLVSTIDLVVIRLGSSFLNSSLMRL
jgi:hypothetical protein